MDLNQQQTQGQTVANNQPVGAAGQQPPFPFQKNNGKKKKVNSKARQAAIERRMSAKKKGNK